MSGPRALIVDDEPDLCELLAATLARMQVESVSCASLAEARAALARERFQLCLTDMCLPDGNGLELVEWLQASGLPLPVAVITAHGNVETAVRALKAGAFDFIGKPVDLAQLRQLIGSALRLPGQQGQASRMIVGDSPAMQQLRTLAARVARSQAPVHICGESGTGKELVARMIHAEGSRSAGPFVAVNCGAIPAELLESEFFGHRKGAFTGAISDKAGLLQAAEGGTLFLDEVADLPLPMQVKLLRVIQEKRVRPVGATAEQAIDVRILSATHKDLRALVASGQFREDLYYRINVIELRVPPLRERGDDILLLARVTIARIAGELGLQTPELTPEAAQRLAAYAFPGNVRELENILERALALCPGSRITAGDIRLDHPAAMPEQPGPGDGTAAMPPAGGEAAALEHRLESVEREAILRALEAQRYNRTAAARTLGLTLRALRYRMQKLGIS
ncbi:MAG: sigma-54-dependent Fis family transcriptional regulator [Chromatiales bacterium]|nr:sigma-54-dependent Fis family transcriptional regulator [Chromatiales bacterium]